MEGAKLTHLNWQRHFQDRCCDAHMTPWWRGRPTMEGKTARGASSPANLDTEDRHI